MTAPVQTHVASGGLDKVTTGTGVFTPLTTDTNLFGLMAVVMEPNDTSAISLSALTDSQGNTWVKKFTTSGIQGNDGHGLGNNTTVQVEIWYCQNGTWPSSGTTFTFTASRQFDNLAWCVTTWAGVNATTPFDPTSASAFSVGATSGNCGASVTTATADTDILIVGGTASNGTFSAATFNGGAQTGGFNNTESAGTWWAKCFLAWKTQTATQSGYPVTFGTNTDLTGLVFGLTADAVPPPPVNPARIQSTVIF